MKPLLIKKTKFTPQVELNFDKILIEGVSMPEDPTRFYQEVFNWLENDTSKSPLVLEIFLEYFNSSSALILVDLMKKVIKSKDDAKIIWRYTHDDEDLKEAGEEYQVIIGNQLELLEV